MAILALRHDYVLNDPFLLRERVVISQKKLLTPPDGNQCRNFAASPVRPLAAAGCGVDVCPEGPGAVILSYDIEQ